MYVVDRSFAVKWFLPEPQANAAVRVRGSRRSLQVPDLFQLEFGSAVLKRIRRREITLEEGIRMIEDIRLVPMQHLALAVMLSAYVVTADRRFLRLIADTEYAQYALWIEDLHAA